MTETATLGGGCFWCLEAVYQEMEGVAQVRSGYMGGQSAHPTYEQVCGGRTGHAEVVEVTFDPSVTSYSEILDVFFVIHDPTTLDRQGNDVGSQYRSVIFFHSDAQRRSAEEKMRELAASGAFRDPVVTALEPVGTFYIAEEYHQNYFRQHPNQGYSVLPIASDRAGGTAAAATPVVPGSLEVQATITLEVEALP
jgi:peptide-methionine (S)-S-oxide reductase